MATETRHIISNVNALWSTNAYTNLDNTVESPSTPSAVGITANDGDDNEDQQYNLAQPTFSGYKFVTAIKIWAYPTVLDDSPIIRVKINGIVYGEFNLFNINTWTSNTVSGLWIASDFSGGWVMSALSPTLDKDESITIKAMYTELTVVAGTTNLRGGVYAGGNYANT